VGILLVRPHKVIHKVIQNLFQVFNFYYKGTFEIRSFLFYYTKFIVCAPHLGLGQTLRINNCTLIKQVYNYHYMTIVDLRPLRHSKGLNAYRL